MCSDWIQWLWLADWNDQNGSQTIRSFPFPNIKIFETFAQLHMYSNPGTEQNIKDVEKGILQFSNQPINAKRGW